MGPLDIIRQKLDFITEELKEPSSMVRPKTITRALEDIRIQADSLERWLKTVGIEEDETDDL